MRRLSLIAAAFAAMTFIPAAHAQQQSTSPAPPPAPPYGTPITLEQAKKVAVAAEAYARAHNLTEAVAIVEPSGTLVYFFKMDGTQYAGGNVALDKATSAAIFRRPTTAFEGGLRGGNLYLFNLRGMNAVPGGVPIIFEGKLIGGIGASGGTGQEDTATVEAGVAALK
jgi:glc operon protein GlcG